MQLPFTLLRLGLAGALAVAAAGCGGAGGAGRPADATSRGTPPPVTAPASATPASSAQVPDGSPAGVASPAPARPSASPASISTTEASQLLGQVDDLLRQLDGDLAADDDAAVNMGE